MKQDYYVDGCQTKHINEFRVELDRGQEELMEDKIRISDKGKL